MKRFTALFCALLALCLPLSGCAALLDRSYSVVVPYTDRFWDDRAEDTMRAENYQDLVNSLLMLIEERAQEGVIRYYGDANLYQQAAAARKEVCDDTMPGSYLVDKLTFSYEGGSLYRTLTFSISYREDAQPLDSIMSISDAQSLTDLLRLAVREGHHVMTAQFTYDTPKENVYSAVESLWRELCRDALGHAAEPSEPVPASGLIPAITPGSESAPKTDSPDSPTDSAADSSTDSAAGTLPENDTLPDSGGAVPASSEPPPDGSTPPEPDYPPCPWEVRFYPDMDAAGIVEILLDGTDGALKLWVKSNGSTSDGAQTAPDENAGDITADAIPVTP